MNAAWSYVLSFCGIAGMALAGNKRRSGWLVAIATEWLWLVYAIATHQYGFIFGAIAYGAVFVRNFIRWSDAVPTS